MSLAHKHPEMPANPAYKKIDRILVDLKGLLHKLEGKEKDHPVLQKEVDLAAKQIITVINDHHSEIARWETYLKNAIIDLTEVPYMQPQMQRIAFETSIKAAVKNLQSFLDHLIS